MGDRVDGWGMNGWMEINGVGGWEMNRVGG